MTKFLLSFYKGINRLTSGRHGGPPIVTIMSRLLVVSLAFTFGIGPILGHALITMPIGLVVFIAIGLALRVVLWYQRRR